MESAFSLKGKNIVITGASSGLGRRCGVVCSQLGANVILVARNEERLDRTMGELAPGEHLKVVKDLTAYDTLEEIFSSCVPRIGKISGLVHSAGLGLTLPLRSTTPRQLEKVFAVNVFAGIELSRLGTKKDYLHEAGSSIVFISSIMGHLGEAGKTGYCASKGALLSAAKAMALELAPKKVRVNCLLPAVVETEMAEDFFKSIGEEGRNAITALHPLGLGRPDDVAHAVAYLLSPASRWVTGTSLVVDGGYSAK